jgi:hypothetical protein
MVSSGYCVLVGGNLISWKSKSKVLLLLDLVQKHKIRLWLLLHLKLFGWNNSYVTWKLYKLEPTRLFSENQQLYILLLILSLMSRVCFMNFPCKATKIRLGESKEGWPLLELPLFWFRSILYLSQREAYGLRTTCIEIDCHFIQEKIV